MTVREAALSDDRALNQTAGVLDQPPGGPRGDSFEDVSHDGGLHGREALNRRDADQSEGSRAGIADARDRGERADRGHRLGREPGAADLDA